MDSDFPDSAADAARAAIPEPASAPCMLHEFADESARFLNRAELLRLLDELIEGERAGARALIDMQKECSDPATLGLLRALARDEARFCLMLGMHVTRLDAVPSRATGAFYRKLVTCGSFAQKLRMLDRGQTAVVQRLDDAIPRIADAALHRDLVEMRAVQIRNIRRCAPHIDALAVAGPG